MSIGSERVKRWRRNTKRRLVEAFGGKCAGCGYDRCDDALEFHHIDPTQKDFHLGSARGNIVSWDRIVSEMRKCVMLCSCCHKEVHKGIRNIPADAPRFSEEYANYREKNREQLLDDCPVCGNKKKLKSVTCSRQCAGKRAGVVDWSQIDVLSLYEEHKNYTKIGDMFGVTGAAIKRRVDRIQKGYY